MATQVQCPNCGQRITVPVAQPEGFAAETRPNVLSAGGQSDNPFASPTADLSGPIQPRVVAEVSHDTVEMLRGTAPWVTFLSVLGFVSTVFMGIASLGMLFAALSGPRGTREFILVVPVYLIGALANAAMAVCLWSYGSCIRGFVAYPLVQGLEAALRAQRNFWRLVGWLAIAYIGLMILAIPAFILMAIMTHAGR